MANQKHLDILGRGVDAWNTWRAENGDTRPDLHQADLMEANLHRVDLSRADMERANLRGAALRRAVLNEADMSAADLMWTNLTGANLTEAILAEANLGWAELDGADLSGADLSGAVLVGADLRGANLRGANLEWANLGQAATRGADVSGASLLCTTFAEMDLRGVEGLEDVVHVGPSRVGIDTLYASEGAISEVFLRGCGVPDDMIRFARSIPCAIQLCSCFISYSLEDEVFARRLYNDLQGAGIRCWLAQEDLKPGDKMWSVIEGQIRIKDKLVLILSEASIRSEYVQREVKEGLEQEEKQGRQLLGPIYIDDAALKSRTRWVADLRKDRYFGDFRGWADPAIYDVRLKRVIDWLKPSGAEPNVVDVT